jgi:hypothetical protein
MKFIWRFFTRIVTQFIQSLTDMSFNGHLSHTMKDILTFVWSAGSILSITPYFCSQDVNMFFTPTALLWIQQLMEPDALCVEPLFEDYWLKVKKLSNLKNLSFRSWFLITFVGFWSNYWDEKRMKSIGLSLAS